MGRAERQFAILLDAGLLPQNAPYQTDRVGA
jgi:hypothetical protein